MRLDVHSHDRDAAGMTYVYPVVSRRARGVSIGVNLNPNSACNWRCVYCQVPGLVYGKAPPIDLERLEAELRAMLARALDPAWMAAHVPEDSRRLSDIAISGNGEPTSSLELPEVVGVIERVLRDAGKLGELPVVLITNGSLAGQKHVHEALEHLARIGGVVWFKLDAVSDAAHARLHGEHGSAARYLAHLERTARLCPTWIQTMVLDFEGSTFGADAEREYVEALRPLLARGTPLRGILLYGLARASHQPEAKQLAPVPKIELERLGERLAAALGLEVRVSA